MRVLVVGASGYIGSHVAVALRRAGHQVLGYVRSDKAAAVLRRSEITPVIGDDVSKLAACLDGAAAVVDCSSPESSADPYKFSRELLLATEAVSKRSLQKKRFVMTSGLFVHGDHRGVLVDETTPPNNPFGASRVDAEKLVINSVGVVGTVVRPGWVYGGSCGKYITGWWGDKGSVDIEGNAQRKWSWVHADDLADAYVRIVNAPAGMVGGEIFEIGDGSRYTYEQIRVAMSRAAGGKGPVKYIPRGDDFWSKMSDVEVVVRAEKAARLLGWHPVREQFLDAIDVYYQAYVAYANPK